MRRIKLSELLVLWGLMLFIVGATSAFAQVRDGLASPSRTGADEVVAEDVPIQAPLPALTATPFQPGNPAEDGIQVDDLQPDGFLSAEAPAAAPAADENLGYVPFRLVIPTIDLDAPIVAAKARRVRVEGKVFQQWEAPDLFAAGWLPTSATLGQPGNTVLDGHHNVEGAVFARLVDLKEGDLIEVYSGYKVFSYAVINKMILEERDMPLATRIANAQWLEPSDDERLTLVTCWPYFSNTHRLIIVARPMGSAQTQ